MTDKCPSCGAHRGELSQIICYHDWHLGYSRPELVFSFRLPGPEYSKTVRETELKRMIDEAKLANYRHMPPNAIMILTLAAERMIEQAKALSREVQAPKPLKLNPAISIRYQLAELLKDIGLEPDRFLNQPPSEINNVMCGDQKTLANQKAAAQGAAADLAQILKEDIGVTVTPILLRLWLVERWADIAKLARKIHGSA